MDGVVGVDAAPVAKATELHELAPLFIEEIADRIAAMTPDVVGFTAT
ncbi:hypothetical protein [Nonomuraea sp. NPDC049158]